MGRGVRLFGRILPLPLHFPSPFNQLGKKKRKVPRAKGTGPDPACPPHQPSHVHS